MKQELRLGDGRVLAFQMFGAPFHAASGQAVIALHGTPGSRLKYAPTSDAAAKRCLTLIAVDRWGYGGTDVHQDPSLSAFAADIAELADHLALRQFRVVGISGGGPYAAATAATLGNRVTDLALVAPVGLIRPSAAGLDPVPLTPFHRALFTVLPRAPLAVRSIFNMYDAVLRLRPRFAIGLGMVRSGASDRALLDQPVVVAGLARMMREGLSRSARGPAIDLQLFSNVWDVDLSAVTARAGLWFGDEDGSVPVGAVNALAAALPGCQDHRLTGQGHFWIATRFNEVLDWLAAEAG